MTRKIFIPIIISLLSFCCIQPARALFIREYTKERPLIIVNDWEFPPYEFRNDMGQPDGYNVEVLDKILNELKIPHRFVMQEWYQCTETFEKREADLIHALTFLYNKRPYVATQNMITYYNIRVARHQNTKPLYRLDTLGPEDTLRLKRNDYAALRVSEMEDKAFQVKYHTPREALIGIRKGKYQYFAWGEIPLSLKIKELDLDSIVLDETDIPSGELRIIGYDKELIDAIDDTFARLEQGGELEVIRDKWFHPERIHNDTSPYVLFLLAGIIIVIIIAFLLSRLIRIRVKAAVNKSLDLNQMMEQALNMGNYSVVVYDIKGKWLHNEYGHLLPEEGMHPQEFLNRLLPGEGETVHNNNVSLIKREKTTFELSVTMNTGTKEKPVWRTLFGKAHAEGQNGSVPYIIYTAKDITEELHEENLFREMGIKYQQIFSTNIIAMSFYDKDGVLLDVNDKMRQLCELNVAGEKFFRETNLFDVNLLKGQIDPTSHENFHVCQRMHYSYLSIDKFIEFKIHPIVDENDEIKYYLVTARDLSSERDVYLKQRKHDKDIMEKSEAINHYEKQLHYLLENSKMFIWDFAPDTGKITFVRTSRYDEFTETVEQFFDAIDDESRQSALDDIRVCVAERKPYNAVHHYKYTPIEKRPVWYAISGVPKFDEGGQFIAYTGIARNITRLMDTQEKLKVETERAENSGKMKSAFLANMTHEIRTPLNAIVGFSDLLPMVDTDEERLQFIRIIRNNCDMLMRLINDILEASNIGQALAIHPKEVDFAQSFDDICQTLAQRVQEAGVEFIKDNPYDTFPATVDTGRIQQVLTNFTTNAVKYTTEGHIKVGYREENGGIYYYCEDTGAGIPKDKQDAVFERFVKLNDFVQGTGLGLSICKAIAERCGGKIGVTSEGPGHGSTFWFWTPKKITPPKYSKLA